MIRRILFVVAIVMSCLAGSAIMIPAQTHDHAAMTSDDGNFNPYVISDNRGGFLHSFVQRKAGRSDVFFRRSSGAGQLSPAVRVNDRPGDGTVRNENPPKIAIGQNNEVFVVWANERERWKGNIRFARSLDGGKSFQPAIDLNSGASQPPVGRAFESIAVDSKGRIFVAWLDERNRTAQDRGAEIWMTVSEDNGRTFSKDRKILSDACECCRIALATDSGGRLFLSYRLVPPSGPMFRDIAVARSMDNGKTFQSQVVSRDGWELAGCPIAGASMAVDDTGRLHVVWFTQTGDTPSLYIASSTDHGTSFSKPAIFDRNQKLAKHAHIAPGFNKKALIAWDDVNGQSMVKWGLYDPDSGLLQLLGTQTGASYPIVAVGKESVSVVALQPELHEVFRTTQSIVWR
jgi:hypothetical protein